MNRNTPLLFFNTIRYLKAKQIVGQVACSVKSHLPISGYKSGVSPLGEIASKPFVNLAPFLARRWIDGGQIEDLGFKFLNESVQFAGKIDWFSSEKSRLWRYNLHYFDYLLPEGGLSAARAVALMRDWIETNPPGTPNAWDPYPLSLRIVNWIKNLITFEISGIDREVILGSLYAQSLWLYRSLEKHLLANHLFKNLKALIFAGLFFKDPRAAQWLEKSLVMAKKEVQEQILPDGGHFERSPMYHSMILEDCIDIINICDGCNDRKVAGVVEFLKPTADKMILFLRGLTHPEGHIGLFNDAAFGIEATPNDLENYYKRVTGVRLPEDGTTTRSFPDTGYFVMTPDVGDKLIVDCGKIGPDYQPGHSHCDTLSFELSLRGKRVVVDSGCFGYQDGEMRRYNRGNAGHNTVTVDGENQSEVWGSHRCARRARPLYARIKAADGMLTFEGAHDGYRRLIGKPVHHRKIIWREKSIDIEDTIDGGGKHDLELRLHINPDLRSRLTEDEAVILDGEAVIARIQTFPSGNVTLQQGWYCPEFGKKLSCDVLVNGYKQVRLPFTTNWTITIP
ncbi:MAG: alginate lyase family protein [Syntrophorhabdaceae bacterium]